MDWKDVAGKIAGSAPQLGALLGSVVPGVGNAVGGAAGMGIKALASAFGLSPEAGPEEIAAAIEQDPQAAMKVKVAEMDYRVSMRELEIEELKVKQAPYMTELGTKTVPWVDALHKMGRQITNWLLIAVGIIGILAGHEFSQYDLILLAGGNTLYQLIKGKGK